MACNGLSLTTKTSLLPSFRTTPADRAIKVSEYPAAMAARLFTEQGATIIDATLGETLEILRLPSGLLSQGDLRPFGDDEMDRQAERGKHLQRPNAKDDAAGPGGPQNVFLSCLQPFHR